MNDVLTHYAVLEVLETASPDEIKGAFRHLAKEYHPDRVPAHLTKLRKDAEERFKQINEAYQVLGSVEKRGLYDERLKENRRTASQTSDATHGTPGGSAESAQETQPGFHNPPEADQVKNSPLYKEFQAEKEEILRFQADGIREAGPGNQL